MRFEVESETDSGLMSLQKRVRGGITRNKQVMCNAFRITMTITITKKTIMITITKTNTITMPCITLQYGFPIIFNSYN